VLASLLSESAGSWGLTVSFLQLAKVQVTQHCPDREHYDERAGYCDVRRRRTLIREVERPGSAHEQHSENEGDRFFPGVLYAGAQACERSE
jgi:hypothetical protein